MVHNHLRTFRLLQIKRNATIKNYGDHVSLAAIFSFSS